MYTCHACSNYGLCAEDNVLLGMNLTGIARKEGGWQFPCKYNT